MRRPSPWAVLVVLLVVLAGGLVAYEAGVFAVPGADDHDRAVVTLVDENGTVLATVEVRVADTRPERLQGLSDATALPDGEGMLFVHANEGSRAYVMRDMAFPLDIVFVGADREVTAVREAPVPPPDADSLREYRARGKYVLELPRGFAAEHGFGPGDRIRIDYRD